MSPALRIGAMGFGLIALSYGFARFAFGMFLPQIDTDLGLGPVLSGVVSGGSFASYCIAIVLAAALTERVGARAVATAAGLVAAIGMAGIALAPSAMILAIAVIIAGSSAGLASPPMAAAVASVVRQDRQDLTNTVINAGTSAGVALSGPLAFAIGGQWRLAFGVLAVVALAVAMAAARTLPSDRSAVERVRGLPPLTGPVLRLVAATFLVGMASTAVWSFGGQLARQNFGWGPMETGVLWSCIGTGGLAGAFAGGLVARFGLDRVHWMFLGLMAIGILSVGTDVVPPPLALAGGVLFGAAYVMLTGVYLIWGVRAVPDRPATGLMVGFLTFAVGQTVGAPIFGYLMAGFGAGPAVTGFAALSLVAAMCPAGTPAPRATGDPEARPTA